MPLGEEECTTSECTTGECTTGDDAESKAARLARKAASARQARLRHKGLVHGRQREVDELREHAASLEQIQAAWAQQLRNDLRAALPPDRWATLEGWLQQSEKDTAPSTLMGMPPLTTRPWSSDEDSEARRSESAALLCALSLDSPILNPIGYRSSPLVSSSSVSSTNGTVGPLSAIPEIRLQTHQAESRNRRNLTTAAARQRATSTPSSGDGVAYKPFDLIGAAKAASSSPQSTPSPTSVVDALSQSLPTPLVAAEARGGINLAAPALVKEVTPQ